MYLFVIERGREREGEKRDFPVCMKLKYAAAKKEYLLVIDSVIALCLEDQKEE